MNRLLSKYPIYSSQIVHIFIANYDFMSVHAQNVDQTLKLFLRCLGGSVATNPTEIQQALN